MDARMATDLVSRALRKTLTAKCPGQELRHRSDRGARYCIVYLPSPVETRGSARLDVKFGKLLRQHADGEFLGHTEE